MNKHGIDVTASDDGGTTRTRGAGGRAGKRLILTSLVAVYLSLTLSDECLAQSLSFSIGKSRLSGVNSVNTSSIDLFVEHQSYEHSTIRWFHHIPPSPIFKLSGGSNSRKECNLKSTRSPEKLVQRNTSSTRKSKRCWICDHYFSRIKFQPVFGFDSSFAKPKLWSKSCTGLPVISANLTACDCIFVVETTPYEAVKDSRSFSDLSVDNCSISRGVATESFLNSSTTSVDSTTGGGFYARINESNTVTEDYSLTTKLMHGYGIINKLLFGHKEPSKAGESRNADLSFKGLFKSRHGARRSGNTTHAVTTSDVIRLTKKVADRKGYLNFKSSQHCPTEHVYLPEYEKLITFLDVDASSPEAAANQTPTIPWITTSEITTTPNERFPILI